MSAQESAQFWTKVPHAIQRKLLAGPPSRRFREAVTELGIKPEELTEEIAIAIFATLDRRSEL